MAEHAVQHTLKTRGGTITYWLTRTRQKSNIRIRITNQGIFVSAPRRASLAGIKRLLLANLDWISETLDRISLAKKEFKHGEVFQYLGRDLPLSLRKSARASRITVTRTSRRLLLHAPSDVRPEAIRNALLDWYREEAREIIPERVSFWARKMGLMYGRVSIKDQKTKWASCSSKGNLNFSLRMVMMPEKVIDYLVVHELSHIRVPKHPKAFWELVGSVLSDYRDSERWLKENGWKFKW